MSLRNRSLRRASHEVFGHSDMQQVSNMNRSNRAMGARLVESLLSAA